MARRNGGVSLSSKTSVKRAVKKHQHLIPYFSDDEDWTGSSLDALLKKYENITTPCSMRINDGKELAAHISTVYRTAYAHYILGKNNMPGFPDYCCGTSGRNVTLSLIKFGYPNAAYAYNNFHDHGYVILPFAVKNSKLKGAIVADPTSDQMWENLKSPPRNAVFIALGNKWDYRTGWRDGANLFPNRILNIETLRYFRRNGLRLDSYDSYKYRNGQAYLKKAFANPVNISPENL
ncbi:MAG: hypothetical protein NTY99_00775 [DPANN group archaeon]|nr:hypothetical protein [DPANN group archaeon]